MQAGEEGWCWDGEGASHVSRQIQLDGRGPAVSTWGVGKDGGGARVMLRSEPGSGGSPSVVPDQLH